MPTASPITTKNPRRDWLLALLLLLAAILPELPAVRGEFQWDDEELHINKVAEASSPFTFFSPTTSATHHAQGNYYPLSMLAFWCEYQLFALDTTGYHLINFALHANNVLLAWLLLRRLKAPWPFTIALLFALHPLVVESVAYISELKNLLSALFLLAATHLWLSWQQSQKPRHALYAFMLLSFTAAMLAKSTACTFPAALLLLDYWRTRLTRRSLLATLPLFLIGALIAALFITTEHAQVGAQGDAFNIPLLNRFLIAPRALCFYAAKFLWPTSLLTVYPHWSIDPKEAWQFLFPLITLGLFLTLWLLRKKIGRGPFTAAALFALLLSPSLGFIIYYPMLFTYVANHYVYLALLPIAAAVVALAQRLLPKSPFSQFLISALLALLLVGPTWMQATRWRDGVALWSPTVAGNTASWYATANLAYAYVQAGKNPEAQECAIASLALKEENPRAHFTLALADLRLDEPGAAVTEYRRGLDLESTNAVAWLNYGYALEQVNCLPEAEQAYQSTLQLDPAQPKAWNELAVLRLRRADWSDAEDAAKTAINLAPDYGLAYVNLGLALEKQGNIPDAIRSLTRALQLIPPNDRIQQELARLRQMQAPTSAP